MINRHCTIYLIYICIALISLSACGPKTFYKESKSVADAMWAKDNPLIFEFDVEDTVAKYDIILAVTYKEDFKYTNQYISVNTIFPNSKKIEDIVSLELTKSNGETYGKCSGNDCTVPILFQENISFSSQGKYKIIIGQYSRMDTISGIESMEFKLLESAVKKS
jgi:gliding motility-associated lipoprotein GldH